MKKQTIIDQIEITRDGTIQVRFAKQVVDDDGTVLNSAYHRTAFPPGHDIDAQMAAVNENLVRDLKCMPVDAAEIARIKAVTPVVWTKAVKDAHRAKMAAQ